MKFYHWLLPLFLGLLALFAVAQSESGSESEAAVLGKPASQGEPSDLPVLTELPRFESRRALTETLGINVDVSGSTDAEIDAVWKAGFRYIRFDIFWTRVEKAKGKFTWERYESAAKKAFDRGLKPIFLLGYSNSLYDSDGLTFNEASEIEGFVEFATRAVRKFHRDGAIWELGNEQNSEHFWKSRKNGNNPESARERARVYMALIKRAIPAMRREAPDITIISGGLINLNWNVTHAWLDEAMKDGLLNLVDGLGLHPYGKPEMVPEEKIFEGVRTVRSIVLKHGGPKDFPLYQTEYGVGIHNADLSGVFETRLLDQAAINLRTYLSGVMVGFQTDVLYEWVRRSPQWKAKERGFVSPEGKPRVVLKSFETLADELDGYRLERRIATGTDEQFVLLFRKAKAMKVVAWSLRRDGAVSLPFPKQRAWERIDMTGNKLGRVTMRDGWASFPITRHPCYLVPSRS